MSGRASYESCGHDACAFPARAEYCPQLASDPDGAAGIVTQVLDELIYETDRIMSDGFEATFDSDEQVATRDLSRWVNDGAFILSPIETSAVVQHTYDKVLKRDIYSVALGWTILRDEMPDSPFVTTYGIDVYKRGGAVQGYVEEMSVVDNGKLEMRPMTEYDYEKLYDELSEFARLKAIEARTTGMA